MSGRGGSGGERMQIGEVAARTGLSLRTIRYYEEVGLVTPTTRTPGGFRVYTEADAARLELVKRMKSLEFTLEETRSLLAALNDLAGDRPPEGRRELVDGLAGWCREIDRRCALLRERLQIAEGLGATLDRELAVHRQGTDTVTQRQTLTSTRVSRWVGVAAPEEARR